MCSVRLIFLSTRFYKDKISQRKFWDPAERRHNEASLASTFIAPRFIRKFQNLISCKVLLFIVVLVYCATLLESVPEGKTSH